MKLKILALIVLLVFVAGTAVFCEAKGGGARAGGKAGSFGSVSKAKSSFNNKATSNVKLQTGSVGGITGFAAKIKTWLSGKRPTAVHSGPATPVNNYYYSNGHYNGWNGLFWGYIMGRAMLPHSYPVNQHGQNEYSLSDSSTTAGSNSYTWDEPTVGENIISYSVLLLAIVLVVLVVWIVYRTLKRRFCNRKAA